MKSRRYFACILILASLIYSGAYGQKPGAPDQKVSFGFFETCTWSEVLSEVDPSDNFFKWVDTEGVNREGSKLGSCQKAHSSKLWKHLHSEAFQKQIPANTLFAWGPEQDEPLKLDALKQHPGSVKRPDKSEIQEVSTQKSAHGSSYDLLITFTKEGAKKWTELTSANVGRSIAIVVNDRVYSAPMVTEPIQHGKCSISGSFTESDVNDLKALLTE